MNQISKIIFLLFLLSKVNYAQNQDQEAKSLLDEVNSKINSYNNIQISFIDLNPREARISLTSVAANLNKFTTFSGVPVNFSRKASS